MSHLIPSKFIFTVLTTLLFVCYNLHAQISFVPPSYNYNSNTYNAGNQNWAIEQGSDGVIYIANNDGLLSYDGANWKLYEMPNNRGVKSVFIDSLSVNEKIYVGSFEEFGYFEKNAANQLKYFSLTHLLKDYTFLNDEIWTINKYRDEIFFQSFSTYFVYNQTKNELKAFKLTPGPLYFFFVNNYLYGQFIDSDFRQYNGREFQTILNSGQLYNDDVVGIVPLGNILLLFLSKNGVLQYDSRIGNINKWKTEIDETLNLTTLNRVSQTNDSLIVLGTLDNGIYVLNPNGTLNFHINKDNGLNNNTILGLEIDKENNVWAALDNGLSYVHINSPVLFYEPKSIQIGLVEDILKVDNNFYFATNQGVYKYINKNIFSLPTFEIQTWFLKKFNSQIIVGHNEGTSFLENDINHPIIESNTGGTDIKSANINGQNVLLQSTYTALQIYTNTNGIWKFSHKLEGFFDLISQIEVDHTGNIWAQHMYKGIYRLRVDQNLRKITEKEYFSSLDSLKNNKHPIKLMKLRGRIVFTDNSNFYTYDDIKRQITPFEQLNSELSELYDTHDIKPVNDSTFWFIRRNEYTLVQYTNGSYKIKEKIPFNTLNNPPNKNRGNIYIDDEGISYLCLNGGIGKYNPSQGKIPERQKLSISNIISTNKKRKHTNFHALNEKCNITFSENDLSLQFQFPNYTKRKIVIERFLEGYDTEWLTVDNSNEATYTNLPAGNYKMKARVIDEYGKVLSTVSHSFQIKNPWYKSILAYILYSLLILLFLALTVSLYIKFIIKKKNKVFLEQEKERIIKLDKQDKIIAELKNEQLETQLTHKSKELASASMLIINHEELLVKLKSQIQENIKNGKFQYRQGAEVLKIIDAGFSNEDEWIVFQKNFDLIHENFFRKLTKTYPALTSTDLRLCALLRLNYSSKDIAKILNLTLRGVETARYRLRKKLGLSEDENLTSFLINFK